MAAAQLTIWSRASSEKLIVISSTTGRRPTIAAPTPAPTIVISENTIVGAGVGAAMVGLRPVVELMTINFSLLALDQIVNCAAAIRYMFGGQVKVPMVIRMPQGAGHQLGPTHSHNFE